jgi:cytochrome d ubiquinol oxidase subunit I
VLAGWFTAEVGRQPWVVYGLLRTRDAVTPSLSTTAVLISLIGYVLVYGVIFSFGVRYVYQLLRDGLASPDAAAEAETPARSIAVALRQGQP